MGKLFFKLIVLSTILIAFVFALRIDFLFAPPAVNPEFIGGVSPHHLVAEDVIKNFYEFTSSKVNPGIIVLLSPDHFGKCSSQGVSFLTVNSQFPNAKIASKEIELLKVNFNIKEDNSSIFLDHGISNHLPFIEKYFSKSEILPILVSPSVIYEETKKLANFLNKILPFDTFIIASVDFSHYIPKQIEDIHDQKSIRALLNFEENEFPEIDVDSWQSLYILRYISVVRGYGSYELLSHKNAQNYSSKYLKSSTSYVSIVFKKGGQPSPKDNPLTLSFVGDIMLDRGVYQKILANSYFYPFYQIEQVFRGIDFVIGNLEGPITYKKENFPRESLRFCFDKDAFKTLQYAHFNVVSLANNHTDNMGSYGLSQTKEILKSGNIDYFGEPYDFKNSKIITKNGIVLVGFNATYPFNLSEVKEWMRGIKEAHQNDLVILYLHFGDEYIGKSTLSDRYLAHTLIDEGADLIMGSHPHVVKDIELYTSEKRGIKTLIFYSLGNFVFDQYFSKETQEGLMIFITKVGKNLQFVLEPVSLTESQPKLMDENERNFFLKNLAEKSSNELKSQISNGIIEITIDY